MKIIILAAGKGERLWPFTKNTPKCLLEIGNGLTMLEAQLLAISKAGGVDEVVVVLGYLADQVEAKIKTHIADVPVRTLYNPFYDTTNNLVSLWLAAQSMEDEFVVINGDDLFKPKILRGLQEKSKKDSITMVLDRKDEYDEDDMKVITEVDGVRHVGKDIPQDEANGESIGMIHFDGAGADRLRESMDVLLRDGSGLTGFWLKALQHAMDVGFPVRFYECSPDDWREMDFHPDRRMVQEALQDHDEILKSWLGR